MVPPFMTKLPGLNPVLRLVSSTVLRIGDATYDGVRAGVCACTKPDKQIASTQQIDHRFMAEPSFVVNPTALRPIFLTTAIGILNTNESALTQWVGGSIVEPDACQPDANRPRVSLLRSSRGRCRREAPRRHKVLVSGL